jgi:hypothetical protein
MGPADIDAVGCWIGFVGPGINVGIVATFVGGPVDADVGWMPLLEIGCAWDKTLLASREQNAIRTKFILQTAQQIDTKSSAEWHFGTRHQGA